MNQDNFYKENKHQYNCQIDKAFNRGNLQQKNYHETQNYPKLHKFDQKEIKKFALEITQFSYKKPHFLSFVEN